MVDPAVEELVRKVAAEVADEVAGRLETRLTDRIETRLEHRMQVHFERIEGLVQRAAEGYGATLESIDRRLDRLEQKVEHGFSERNCTQSGAITQTF